MKIKDKILIVEDEQSISNFISMVLNANGYDTIIVGSGEEALTMIASHCPDLIVLDLGLPDMDGMEVLKSVRKWSNLPVVVVSARNHEQGWGKALSHFFIYKRRYIPPASVRMTPFISSSNKIPVIRLIGMLVFTTNVLICRPSECFSNNLQIVLSSSDSSGKS